MATPKKEATDRIWLAEQEFERNGGHELSEIVIRDESLLPEVGPTWRVTEYRKVSPDEAEPGVNRYDPGRC